MKTTDYSMKDLAQTYTGGSYTCTHDILFKMKMLVPVHRVTKNGIETIYISSMNNIHDITFNVFTGKKYVDKKHKMEIYDNDIYFN
jgi:hypothetical protein